MKKFIFSLTLFALTPAFASNTEVWQGTGALFNVRGKEIGAYSLVVENTKKANRILSKVTVTRADGKIHRGQCVMEKSASGSWKSTCGHGKGGGRCLGEGLCVSYEEDSSGRAFATTIIMDGPSDMRLLRTELQDGEAIRFFREKLQKR